MSQSIEDSIKTLAREVRSKLSEHDVPYMNLSITMTGNMTGGINIAYRLSNAAAIDNIAVEGNSVQPVVSEFLRQYSWKKWNRPQMISHTPPATWTHDEKLTEDPPVPEPEQPKESDDEIPF